MRAIVVHEFGPIASHKVEDWPEPTIGPEEVLIDTRAIGLNYPDTLMLQGKYQKRPAVPFVPGRDVSGMVRAVGEKVTRCKAGDPVVAQVFTGAFAEAVAAPQERCFVMPEDMAYDDAAAMITVFNTAWVAVELRGKVKEGDIVMVTGAAGGVGLAAVQLCAARGATVLAAVSSKEKGDLAMENGAAHVIDTNADGLDALKRKLQAQVEAATGVKDGKACNVVIDTVGADLFEASLRVLAFGGNLVIVGFTGGQIPAAKANYLLYNNLGVMGAPLDIQFEHNYAEMERGVNEMFRLYLEDKVQSNVQQHFELEDFAEAFDLIINRKAMGKLVLTM